ncbi:MAG: hypothetical protein ACR2I5_05875 [Candidatus Limnocylindria bacterium]
MNTHRFPLRLVKPWRWALRVIGVRHGAAQVDLTEDGRVVATFGRLSAETTLENIESYVLTGPYRWWKAIGPRGSLADHGFTFGTSTHGGVCLCFAEPVESGYVRGGQMESLTVTVDRPDQLARALDERAIAGKDERFS